MYKTFVLVLVTLGLIICNLLYYKVNVHILSTRVVEDRNVNVVNA